MTTDLINDYSQEKECIYKNEHYLVRDNGAVLRLPKENSKSRPNDNKWTFGKPGDKKYLYISGVQVHRIVATAFYGQADVSMVVDHIDTNKQNNRADNLRWITKEENITKNPETVKKIEYRTGLTLEELKKDNFKALHKLNKSQNTSWMRPTSKEEADNLRKHQKIWREYENLNDTKENKDKNFKKIKGNMGEWVFKQEPKPTYIQSLTINAGQRDWQNPCEFLCCPQKIGTNPLEEYKQNLKQGEIFSKNQYNQNIVDFVDYSKNKKSLIVKTYTKNGVKNFFICQISFENGIFIHTSLGSFFSKERQEKYFCKYTGKEWNGGDTIDDYC